MVPDALLRQYDGGYVIPIIGCEMMSIRSEGEEDINIHEYVIQQLFGRSSVRPPENLYDLQLVDEKLQQNDISGVFSKISESQKNFSLLNKIAGMNKFPLFIVASLFRDFEDIFKKNNEREDLEILVNDSNNSSQLTNVDLDNGKRKLVYLFDRVGAPQFAINDEDRLEYLFSLAKTSSLENSLLSHLAGKTLLFLGCDFSDWFMRYCIRVLYNFPYKMGPRAYIVNDTPDPLNYQKRFFQKHKIELIHKYPVKQFVDEFFEKAKDVDEFKDRFEGKHVFLSYGKQDKVDALRIFKCLRNRGVNVWYDEREKEVGLHVPIIRGQIMNAARTKVMVCIISAALIVETRDKSKRSYVRDIEWDAGETRIKAARYKNEDDGFGVIPYYVDDPTSYIEDVPPFIAEYFRFGNLYDDCERVFENIKDFLQ